MTAQQAELIDIDFLWYLVDESYEGTIDGDFITFIHPRRGALTALQSGRVALLFNGDVRDNRGLPATGAVLPLALSLEAPPSVSGGASGVVIPFRR